MVTEEKCEDIRHKKYLDRSPDSLLVMQILMPQDLVEGRFSQSIIFNQFSLAYLKIVQRRPHTLTYLFFY